MKEKMFEKESEPVASLSPVIFNEAKFAELMDLMQPRLDTHVNRIKAMLRDYLTTGRLVRGDELNLNIEMKVAAKTEVNAARMYVSMSVQGGREFLLGTIEYV